MSTSALEVRTVYLEMRSRSELKPARTRDPNFAIREIERGEWELNRSLYLTVGESWYWTDKRCWTDAEWRDYATSESLRTFTAEHEQAIAGYYELRRDSREVEIAYFGLMPEFIGRGLGGALLTSAIEQAWHWKASRVWVHTCSLDHPSALRNYEARGMRRYATTTHSI